MSENTDQEPRGWFAQLLGNVVQSYARNTNLEFFQRKYPGLPPQTIAERRIKAAAFAAGLVGFLSGGVIAIAGTSIALSVLGTFISGLTASPVTVPALAVAVPLGGAAFVVEVSVLVWIQLHLAYDLFVLYGLPIDFDDPEDLQQVVSVAFGIKSAEMAGQAIQKAIPQLAPTLLRKGMRAGLVRRKFQEWIAKRLSWAFARKYVAEGVLVRYLVPGISVFTATAWDYASTQSIGHRIKNRIKRRGLAAKRVDRLSLEHIASPTLLLHASLELAMTESDLSETEVTFYSTLVARLCELHGDQAIDALKDISFLEWDDIVADLADIESEQEKAAIYQALAQMTVVKGRLYRKQVKRLKNIAELYGLPFDLKKLKTHTTTFREPQPLQSCLIGVIILFVLMLISCGACSLTVWLTVLQSR